MRIIAYLALPAIALFGVLWLAFLDHNVSWDSKILGHITIHPRSAPPPPECKEIVSILENIKNSLLDDKNKLDELRKAASSFDTTFKHPDWTRFWAEAGQNYSKDNWNRVKEQEVAVGELVDKLLPNIEKVHSACSS